MNQGVGTLIYRFEHVGNQIITYEKGEQSLEFGTLIASIK